MREIVYSARYYSPPNKPNVKTSWHLYAISPDGAGRQQLTSGAFDDTDPKWSPDGSKIAFLRRSAAGRVEVPADETVKVCLIGANGGAVRVLTTLRDHAWWSLNWCADGRSLHISGSPTHESGESLEEHFLLDGRSAAVHRIPDRGLYAESPSGRYLCQSDVRGASIQEQSSGKSLQIATLPMPLAVALWKDDQTLLCIPQDTKSSSIASPLLFLDPKGKVRQRLPLRPAGGAWESPVPSALTRDRFATDSVLYGVVGGESTGGHYNEYFRVSLKTGEARAFTDGKFLAWSPDGKRFCTVVRRDTEDYDKRSGGQARTVWTSPLLIGDGATGKTKPLVQGFVYVLSADWRPG